MKNATTIILTICLLLSATFPLFVSESGHVETHVKETLAGSRATLIVDGVSYPTIFDAVAVANPGDTIRVYAGNWVGMVSVSKTLTFIGNGSANTTIDGGMGMDVLSISASWVNVTGFMIKGAGSTGKAVNIMNAHHVNIKDCNISTNVDAGINSWNGSYLIVDNCIFKNNTGSNIQSQGSQWQTIKNCQILGSLIGRGVYFSNGNGNCTISNSTIFGNYAPGVELNSGTNNVTIRNCTIKNNNFGVFTQSAKNNRIYNNNFISNGPMHASGVGACALWNSTYPAGGNYWDDSTGVDNLMGPAQDQPGKDGMEDIAHIASNGGVDSYPWDIQNGWQNQVNFQPVIVSPTVPDAQEDTPYQVAYTANDGNFDPLTFSLKTNTSFLAIGPANGTVYGIPANQDVGSYFMEITVSDGRGGMNAVNKTFKVINVNDKPLITGTNVLTAAEDALYEVFYTASDIDPTGDTLAWGYTDNATWLSFDTGAGRLYGTPGNADIGIVGVTLNVSDGKGGKDQRQFDVSVSNANDLPVLGGTDLKTATEDMPYMSIYTASDIDPTNDTLTFGVVTNASFLGMNASSGVLSGMPLNEHVGSFWVNVSVSDAKGGLDCTNFSLSVENTNDAPMIDILTLPLCPIGVPYSVDFNATDVDPTLDTLTWSLSTNASFMSINDATGVLSGTPSNIGSFWVNVTVKDGKLGADSYNFTLNVQVGAGWGLPMNVSISAARTRLMPTEGTEITVRALGELTALVGATVTIASSDGKFNESGKTDADGAFTVTYTAPIVLKDTVITLTATVDLFEYKRAVATLKITVSLTPDIVNITKILDDINKLLDNGNLSITAGVEGDVNINIDEIVPDVDIDVNGCIGIFVNINLISTGKLKWVNISITYEDLPAGLNEENLKLYYLDEDTNDWVLCENTGVIPEQNLVWANVTHFTIFAPADKTSEPADDDDDDTGGVNAMMIGIIAVIVIVFLIIIVLGVVLVARRRSKAEAPKETPASETKPEDAKPVDGAATAEAPASSDGEKKDVPAPPPDEATGKEDLPPPPDSDDEGETEDLPPPPEDDKKKAEVEWGDDDDLEIDEKKDADLGSDEELDLSSEDEFELSEHGR